MEKNIFQIPLIIHGLPRERKKVTIFVAITQKSQRAQ